MVILKTIGCIKNYRLYLKLFVVGLVFFVFYEVELPMTSEAMLALLTAQMFGSFTRVIHHLRSVGWYL